MHKAIAAPLLSMSIAAARMLAFALPLAACAASPASEDSAARPVAAAPAAAPGAKAGTGSVDRSCRSDADCTVKNVGNCCGYYPACVNVDSETFPERVKAECERTGRSSICGFPSIEGCQCVAGQCEPDAGGQLR